MAEHAVGHGLIPPEARSAVLGELAVQDEEQASKPTVEVARPSPGATRRAVRKGELEGALDEDHGAGAPSNVVVETEEPRR